MNQDTVDVIIVGSGAGAMTTALCAHDLGLSVVMIEKSDQYGGTSAVSGGGIWIPNNKKMKAAGINDSESEALSYLKAATQGEVSDDRLQAYVTHAADMLEYMESKTHVRYNTVVTYADYYQSLPGSKTGGRALDPAAFDARLLGDDFLKLREPSPGVLAFGRMALTSIEAHVLLARTPGWIWLALKTGLRYWFDWPWRFKSKRDRRLGLGNALMAALARSMMDRDIPIRLNTALCDLVVHDGRVTGVRVSDHGVSKTLAARKAVVIACGGFERNQLMRETYLPQPTNAQWSATPPNNTGDGILAGMRQGASTALMNRAWWTPTVHVPGEEKQRGLFSERALPGCLIVNRLGQRFANEAQDYLGFVQAMYDDHAKTQANLPAWMIFDASFRHKYNAGPLMPGSVMSDKGLPSNWRNKVYYKADSLPQLAQLIGVDAQGLQASVQRINHYATTGVDEEFGKGSNAYDLYYGDNNVKPNPCLAPLVKAPFYAIPIDAGDIGTKGGLLTNAHGQVLREDGSVIDGLYSVGNSAASVMGASYPGAGATLGPAMTFGYLSARHIALRHQTLDTHKNAYQQDVKAA